MSEFPALKGNGCAPIFRPPKSVEEMGVPLDSDPPKSVEEMGVPLDLWGNMSGLSGFTGGGRRWG